MLRLSTMLSDRAGLMMKVSALAKPADYNLAESHRRLKELAVGGDAAGAADELRRHLAGTIRALQTIIAS
jgi:DNA-binding GntR family transcriptional regulator